MKFKSVLASLVMATAVTMLPALTEQVQDENLRVEEPRIQEREGEKMISGRVVNTASVPYSYVEIRFRCLNADGLQVSTVSDSTNDLAAMGTWTFDIEISDKVANFELTSLSGEKGVTKP